MRRTFVALAVAVGLVSGACTSDPVDDGAGRRRVVKGYDGPEVAGAKHPFGLKWDWSQIETLKGYIGQTTGGTTFYEFAWCDIESTQGTRDWAAPDRVVASAQRLGYRINLKIRVGQCWVNGKKAAPNQHRVPTFMPRDLRAYGRFVADVVKRYSPKGVNDYAIENEVNAKNFWRGTPAEYRQLVEMASEAAHEASDNVRIFDAGLSSPAWGVVVAGALFDRGERKAALRYYRRYYERRLEVEGFVYPKVGNEAQLGAALNSEAARNARDYFAAITKLARKGTINGFQLHYYDPWSALPRLIKLIETRLGAPIPIEAWEAGVAWPGPSYNPAVHANETQQLMASMLNLGVERVIYLPVSFSPGGKRQTEVVRPLVAYADGAVSAAGHAYATVIDAARGADKWRRIEREGLDGTEFTRDGVAVELLWSATGQPVVGPNGAEITTPVVIK